MSTTADVRLVAAVLATLGCAGAPTRAPGPGRASAAPDDREVISIASLETGHGHTAPIVVAHTPEGLPLELLVDTGAGAHVLWGRAFELIGGEDEATTTHATDAAGVAQTLSLVAGPTLRVGNQALDPVLHAPPSAVEELGIAGVFSPTRVARHVRVRIDLRRGELQTGPSLPALAWDVEGELRSCEPGQMPHARVLAVVDGVPLELVIDTGSTNTVIELDEEAVLGSSLATRPALRVESVTTAAGSFINEALGPVPVRLGARTLEAQVLRTRTGTDCEMGTLGWDVLSQCVLELEGAHVRLACSREPPTLATHSPTPSRILVAAIEVEPGCDADAEQVARAGRPVEPWPFASWWELSLALRATWSEARAGSISEALNLVTLACREQQDTEPEWRFGWRRVDGSSIVSATIAAHRPID